MFLRFALAATCVVVLSDVGSSASTLAPWDPDVASVTDPDRAATYRESVAVARRHFDAEEFDAAIPVLESALEIYAADGEVWRGLGRASYLVRDFERGAQAYARAAAIGVPFRANVLYNQACCLALAGRVQDAVSTLRAALDAGFENRPLVARDTDLEALHDHPAWTELAGLLPADVEAAGRDAGWRHDLDFWFSEVRRLHPAPFRRLSEDAFAARVVALRDRIPDLDDEEIFVELQKLTVLLGDGHSGIRPLPGSRVDLRRIPLQLYAFVDGLFVIDADESYRDLVGSEVLRIGNAPIEDLWTGLEDLVPRDNPMGLLDQGPLGMTITTMLRALDAIGDTEDVPLTVRDRDGIEREAVATSIPMRHANREFVAPDGAEVPLFLQHEDQIFWFGPLPGMDDAVYAQFNVVRNGPDASVEDHAMRLRAHLAENPATDVVVLDLRHNGGGNSFLYPPLVRVLSEYRLERESARLYVLMGRRTFSACQNLVTDLDTWADALFVGEPSGSTPNQIGESTHSVLPFSGLRAGISSRLHQQSFAGDDRPYVAPDLPVAFTSEAYFAGRDPVLDAVFAAEAHED